MALLGKFFGNTVGQGAAFAIGASTARTLNPVLQSLANEAWTRHPDMPIEAGTLALGVAQGQIPSAWAYDEAARTGINGERFTHLVDAANTGPGIANAFDLWRRGVIDDNGFRRAVRRQGLESEWIEDLVQLKNVVLSPAQIALGIVRSLINDPGFLPVDLPTGGGKVPAYPVSNIDAVDEAAKSGVTSERLRVMVGEIGLPMSPDAAASAVFRNIIERADFNRAILEGNTRPEWADAIFEQARDIPSASQFVNHHLRGWSTEAEMYAGAARHGMSHADTDVLFETSGRPPSWHQIWIGLQRGGVYDGPLTGIDPAFLKGLRESNIRPEWYNLLWHSRYTYPSAFVLRALTGDGTFTAAQTETALTDMGWRPDWAKQAAEKWAGGTAATGSAHVKKAQTSLYNTARTGYLAGDVTDAEATTKMGQAGVPAGDRDDVLALWKHEREIQRQRLTATQVKKAYTKAVPNPATGAPWSRDDALAELLSRGWSSADANTFLDE